jgi:hypothetical protein
MPSTASAVPAAMLRERGLRRENECRGGNCSEKESDPGRNTQG